MMRSILSGAALALVLAVGAASSQPSGADTSGAPSGGGRSAMRQACIADIQKLCADTQPGGGRIMQCLRGHADQVSADCKSAMQSARAARREQRQSTPSAAPPAS